jgi:hypothetical protein
LSDEKIRRAVVKALNRRGWTPPQSKMAMTKRVHELAGCFSLSRRAKDILQIRDHLLDERGNLGQYH